MNYGSGQPARVETALQTLYFIEHRHGCDSTAARPLSRQEEALRSTAMRVLQLYLSGEMDYAEAPEKNGEAPGEPGG